MLKSLVAFVGIVIVALALTACGGAASAGNNVPNSGPVAVPTSGTGGGPASQPGQTGAMTINGAGATFPYPLYSRWFYDYAFVNPKVKFNYQSIGSGGGIAQITAKTVDFGASDAILTDEQLSKAPGLQMFPSVAGAIVPTYNLKDAQG